MTYQLLVVEDDPSQWQMLSSIMGREGFSVAVCATAKEALECLETGTIDVAVVEARLPDMEEKELLTRLSAFADDVPIVLYTGYASLQSARNAVNIGAFAYVEKQADPSELIGHVRRAVEKRLKPLQSGGRGTADRKVVGKVTSAQLRLIEYAADHTVKELLQRFLDEAEYLTQSKIGFYHFVDDDQERLVLQTWSTNTLKNMCTAEGEGLHYAVSEAGVWVDCVRERKPVVHNDYENLPHKKGLPEGHAPLVRELVVPVLRGDKIVSILGVGNKETNYDDDDVRTVEQLAVLAWETVVRRQAEEALRNANENLTAMLDALPDLLFEVDREGRIYDFRAPDPDLLYAPPEVFLNKTMDEVLPMEAAEVFTEAVAEAAETGRHRGGVYSLKLPAGLKWFELSIAIRGAKTPDARFVALVRDITGRKQAEEERLSLQRQVQHAQKLESLGVLAGGIAHDFNNFLMGILGNADLALNELSPMSPARRNLEEIEKASRRAADLASQMLAYSGKGRFVVEPIDANELVDEMAHLLEVSISKKAVLKYNFADNLPTFDGDVTQIRQVVMNLITNASEAIGAGSGYVALSTGAMHCDRAYLDEINDVLQASLDEPLPEGIYTYLEVADTGCGMDAETIEKIFDPFFTTKFTGRGLGMSAVLGIVRGHQGALKIYSEVGKGTTFKVLFPANELPMDDTTVRGRDEAEGKDWRGCGTVLIADDEQVVCVVAKQMLERLGFDVLTASDGREAMKVLHEHADEIVCVLLDLTMPQLDGEETFREIRLFYPLVRVVLCSGYNEQDATQRFVGKGLAGFIQKPFNTVALKKELMRVLSTNDD